MESKLPPQIIPFATMSPKGCAWIADRGDEAIGILETWNLSVGVTNPLRAAIAHLRTVARRGSYGSGPDELGATAKALMTVFDWNQIANCLTDTPVEAIAEELAEAVSSGAVSAKAEDIRSQFWFGTLLARAGLRPAVPPAGKRRPDFVITVDSMPLSIEVKRPESVHSAMRAIKSAAAQIRDYGRPGFIAVDLGKALQIDILAGQCYLDAIAPEDQFRPVFMDHARRLSDRIRGYKCEGKFARILGLLTFGRICAWHHLDPTNPRTSLFLEAPIFTNAFNGLITSSSNRVKRAVLRAMEELSGNPIVNIG